MIVINYQGLTYISINLMEHRITSNATHTRRSRGAHDREKYVHHRIRASELALRRPPVRKKRRDTTGSNCLERTPIRYRDIRKFTTRGGGKSGTRCRDAGRSGMKRRRVSEDACRLPGRSFDNGARLTGCPTSRTRVPRLEKVGEGS